MISFRIHEIIFMTFKGKDRFLIQDYLKFKNLSQNKTS